jgi:plastocyanin
VIRPKTSLLAATGLLLAVSLVLGACGSGTATSAPTSAPTSAASTSVEPSASAAGGSGASAVAIADFSFSPAALTVKVGQEITWTNSGSASHTVTFDAGGVDSGTLKSGTTFKHAFDAAGTFTYHCNFHSSMKATITVTP